MSLTNTPAATSPSMAEAYARWDELLATRDPIHHQAMHSEMLEVSKTAASADVELWWRIAAVINAQFENLRHWLEASNRTFRAQLEANFRQAKHYAQRALSLVSGHFQANLAMAEALSNELYFEWYDSHYETILHLCKSLDDHLRVCRTQQPHHYMVLYLEVLLPKYIRDVPEETTGWSETVQAIGGLMADQGEAKLRQVIASKPDMFKTYCWLIGCLAEQDKSMEVMQVCHQALTLERRNSFEDYLAELIQDMMHRIEGRLLDDAGDQGMVEDDEENH